MSSTTPVIAAAISGASGLIGAFAGARLSRRATLEGERERQRFARNEAERLERARITVAARLIDDELLQNAVSLQAVKDHGWDGEDLKSQRWRDHAADLALGLTSDEWGVVTTALYGLTVAKEALDATLKELEKDVLQYSDLPDDGRTFLEDVLKKAAEARKVLHPYGV